MNIAGIRVEVIINTVNRGRHYYERAGCRPSKSVLSVVAEHGPDSCFDKVDWVIEVLGPPLQEIGLKLKNAVTNYMSSTFRGYLSGVLKLRRKRNFVMKVIQGSINGYGRMEACRPSLKLVIIILHSKG